MELPGCSAKGQSEIQPIHETGAGQAAPPEQRRFGLAAPGLRLHQRDSSRAGKLQLENGVLGTAR